MPENLDEATLEAMLFPPPPVIAAEQRPLPNWRDVHLDLKRHIPPVRGKHNQEPIWAACSMARSTSSPPTMLRIRRRRKPATTLDRRLRFSGVETNGRR